jgi:hypothetical protein
MMANDTSDTSSDTPDPREWPKPSHKLDFRYFTDPALCPFMVQQKARRAFELFLHLAGRFLESGGQEISATHEQLCRVCRLDPSNIASRSALSRLLRTLRETYRVIDFVPLRRRRPSIALRPPGPGDLLAPKRYVYFRGFEQGQQEWFDRLGSRAFPAEYMAIVSQYEASLAARRYRRPYWFYPLEKIAQDYHISAQFAGRGLRALVEFGMLTVNYGQRLPDAPGGEYGRVNRYYHHGMEAVMQRELVLRRVACKHPAAFTAAKRLSAALANGATVKNVEGICSLIARYGEAHVTAAIGQLGSDPRRSRRRRLAYVAGILRLQFPDACPQSGTEFS